MLDDQKLLLDYWASLPVGDDGIPLKKKFRPAEIASILAHVYLIKAEDDFYLSLIGTELERIAGMTLSGSDLKTISGPMFELYQKKAHDMFAGPVGSYSSIIAHTQGGVAYRFKSLALPMRGAKGEQFVVGYLSTPELVEGYIAEVGSVSLMRFEKTEMIELPGAKNKDD